MFRNYLKIAWRNLLRHKAFSVINILGLSIGIATCTIIYLYVQHDLTYDQYNKNADRIVRVSASLLSPENDLRMATAPALLVPNIKRVIPEVQDAVRIQEIQAIIKWKHQLYQENEFYFISLPIMTIAMRSWLAAWPYHISLGWEIFLVPIAATVLIALAVITREIIRVALVNPVKSLRVE